MYMPLLDGFRHPDGYSVNIEYDIQENHITGVSGLVYYASFPVHFSYQLVY